MNAVEIVYSPTGGTRKVADIIAHEWSNSPAVIDLSDPNTSSNETELHSDDLVVIAMPSFGGRAPVPAIERLGRVRGNGARCVVVCVYGNRAYEDTLVEMERMLRERVTFE